MKKGTKKVMTEGEPNEGNNRTVEGASEEVTYSVGDVLASEQQGVRTPVLVYKQEDNGAFRLADETHHALNSEFTATFLAKCGYKVLAHVEIAGITVKAPKHKIAVETTVETTKESGETKVVVQKLPEPTPEPEVQTPPETEQTPEPIPTTDQTGKKAPEAKEKPSSPVSGSRNIATMCATSKSLYAACSDGTVWRLGSDDKWHGVPSIPQE